MQIIKPTALGLTHRVIETRGRWGLCIGALLYFPFSTEGKETLWAEPSLWPFLTLQMKGMPLIDEGVVKTTPEFLVHGYAYPPEGSATECAVRAQVGSLNKTLLVYGSRYWIDGKPSTPTPFSEMPLDWEHAYGGPDIPENPLGLGSGKSLQQGLQAHWLPNIEDPDHPLQHPSQRVKPVGFGRLDPLWPQRARFRGTYDDRWLREEAPAYPSDLKWDHFNLASPDQWFTQGLKGTESFSFYNMHPQEALVCGCLPGLTARCFVRFGPSAPTATFCDVPMKVNTVWFFPHAKCAVAIVQGICPVREDDASDVGLLLAAVERIGHPLPREHYLEVLKKREDPTVGGLHSLNDADLLPQGLAADDPSMEAAKKEYQLEGFVGDNLFRQMELRIQRIREEVKSKGLDPDALNIKMPEREVMPTLEQFPTYLSRVLKEAEQSQLKTLAESAKELAKAEKLAKEAGVDMAAGLHRGPPTFSAAAELERVKAAMGAAASPEILNKLSTQLAQAEAGMKMNYCMGAHLQAAAPPASSETTKKIRFVLEQVHAAAGNAHGANLTGADLSDMKLTGMDLRGAQMESTCLSNASLEKANLSYAVLAHSKAEGLQAAGAICMATNFGKACLNKANLADANLQGAILSETSLVEANLAGARLIEARVDEAVFAQSDLSRVLATGLSFNKTAFKKLKLCQADLSRCTFIECTFTECDLSGARIDEASFVACTFTDTKAPGASFVQTSFSQGCQLQGFDATGGKFDRANLRGSTLAGARLQGATLAQADLSEADLSNAILHNADLRNALAVRTLFNNAHFFQANLAEAVLKNADLRGSNLQNANLYGCDLSRIYRDEKTIWNDANLDRAKTKPERKEMAVS